MFTNLFQSQGPWARQYRAYSGAFIDKSHLDDGGKVILPASALDELSRMHITYPMLFQITGKNNAKTHSGVLEFSGEEGQCYMPFWMMSHLRISPGDIITVKNVTLSKGTFVKIRPQQRAFVELHDPKAVLEKQLRNFSCLTKGDTIIINYNKNNYAIDIMEVGIKNAGDAKEISIVETDVRVEFERPLDMPEEEPIKEEVQEIVKEPEPEVVQLKPDDGFKPFIGSGKRVDGKPLKVPKSDSPLPEKKDEKDFTPFAGSGKSLSMKKIEVKVEEKKVVKEEEVPFKGLGRTISNKKMTEEQEPKTPVTPATAPTGSFFIPFQSGGRSLK